MNPAHRRILARFGLTETDLIGAGGESLVYGLGPDRILRVRRPGPDDAPDPHRLKLFLEDIDGRLPFATPLIFDVGPGGAYTVEKRLAGRPMNEFLNELAGEDRLTALRNYLSASEAFAAIGLPERPYGQLLMPAPVTADDWPTYFRHSLDWFRRRHNAAIVRAAGDSVALMRRALVLLEALEPRPSKALVHGDYFPGNVLMDDRLQVSGVVDFGFWTLVGDPLYDVVGACICTEMSEECTAGDVAAVRSMLFDRFGTTIKPLMRFYRAYAAFAMADATGSDGVYPKLFAWSVENLKALAENRLEA